jgi:hypothetical protein
MTVTIELKPEVENFLRTKASKNGVKVETFIETFIEENIVEEELKPFHETATKEERRAKFHRWLYSHKDRGGPFLSDEATRRENIY